MWLPILKTRCLNESAREICWLLRHCVGDMSEQFLTIDNLTGVIRVSKEDLKKSLEMVQTFPIDNVERSLS